MFLFFFPLPKFLRILLLINDSLVYMVKSLATLLDQWGFVHYLLKQLSVILLSLLRYDRWKEHTNFPTMLVTVNTPNNDKTHFIFHIYINTKWTYCMICAFTTMLRKVRSLNGTKTGGQFFFILRKFIGLFI